ncbi:anionic trypsin-like [Anoplophora glabripennis]|nr:anionic trypsin-like [Anoplophora glabripennis]
MYVVIPIADEKECNAMYPHRLADSQLCIGFTEGGKDSCGGDSGGPASMSMKVDGERRHYLVALVSYGLTMCGKGVAVYTDVSYFVTWILENIDKS